MYELKKPGKALVDKVSLTNFIITDIVSVSKLVDMGCAAVSTEKRNNLRTLSGEEYSNVFIHDNSISYFVYKLCPTSKLIKCKMDLAVHHYGETDNLNCDDADELNLRVNDAIIYLYRAYGIELSVEDICLSNVEINKTIETNLPFEDYDISAHTLVQNIPESKRFELLMKGFNRSHGDITPGTYYGKSKSLVGKPNKEFKIYNKSAKMKIKASSEEEDSSKDEHSKKHYMRTEFTLNGKKTITRAFGTNLISKITNEMLNNYFNKCFNNYFVKPTNKFLRQQEKSFAKEINEYYLKSPHDKENIIKTFLIDKFDKERVTQKILLLDGEQLIKAILTIKFQGKAKRQEKYRILKLAKDIISNTKSLIGNKVLLDELIEKFTGD